MTEESQFKEIKNYNDNKTNKHNCPRCNAVCYCFADLKNINGYDGCNHYCINKRVERKKV